MARTKQRKKNRGRQKCKKPLFGKNDCVLYLTRERAVGVSDFKTFCTRNVEPPMIAAVPFHKKALFDQQVTVYFNTLNYLMADRCKSGKEVLDVVVHCDVSNLIIQFIGYEEVMNRLNHAKLHVHNLCQIRDWWHYNGALGQDAIYNFHRGSLDDERERYFRLCDVAWIDENEDDHENKERIRLYYENIGVEVEDEFDFDFDFDFEDEEEPTEEELNEWIRRNRHYYPRRVIEGALLKNKMTS